MKKLVSLLLALIMVLGCVPMASAAAPKFVAANMSEVSNIPEEPVVPTYTLETVDGKYVLTVENAELYAAEGAYIYAESHDEDYDWDYVPFTWNNTQKAFVSSKVLDTENYPEEPSLFFEINWDNGYSNVRMDMSTNEEMYHNATTYDAEGNYTYYYWDTAWNEINISNDDGSVIYDMTDGSLLNYCVYTDDYDISYDPYGRINWVQGKADMGDGYTMWVDWDFELETWTIWDPETGESTPVETDLPAFDADAHPALIILPFEVALAPITIDVTSPDVWEETDAEGNVTGYGKSGKNCYCYYDLNGNMTSYMYFTLDGNTGVEYSVDGTLLHGWTTAADGTSYNYYDESLGLKLEDGTIISGWITWDEEGNIVFCDLPAGVEIPPALINAVKAVEEIWYPYNTMCVAGISLKDTYGITDKWYNVVPVDLTKDGTYTFDLVASGMFLIGKANVTVADGNVTVTYGMPWGHGYIKEEVLNWFTSPSQITAEFCEAPTGAYAFGEPVSISEDLGGAEVGLLFICNRVTYRQPYYNSGAHLVRWYSNKPEWKAFREQLMTIMPE